MSDFEGGFAVRRHEVLIGKEQITKGGSCHSTIVENKLVRGIARATEEGSEAIRDPMKNCRGEGLVQFSLNEDEILLFERRKASLNNLEVMGGTLSQAHQRLTPCI